MSSRSAEPSIETRARRRVGMKMGFYLHALIFILVNLGLYVLSTTMTGRAWLHFPLWGWGLGLTIHGIVALISLQGDGLRARMIEREIASLQRKER